MLPFWFVRRDKRKQFDPWEKTATANIPQPVSDTRAYLEDSDYQLPKDEEAKTRSPCSLLLCLYSGNSQPCPESIEALRAAAATGKPSGWKGCVCRGGNAAGQRQAGCDEDVRWAHDRDDLRLQREGYSGGSDPDVSL